MPCPVVLFVYKRPDHTRATLESLARNTIAADTDLIVYSDGPKTLADVQAVNETREIVRAQKGFASVRLIERDVNLGLANSIIAGVTEVLERYGRIIVLEDDLVSSQHFLAYMNDALARYEADPAVFSVTGHTFPADFMEIPKNYPFDTYAGYRCSSWSWGTWKDRWDRVDWSIEYFEKFISDERAKAAFNLGGSDMVDLLRLQWERRIDSWAIRFCYAHHANNMHCIYPTRTLIKNIGLDRSGTHSMPEPRFEHKTLDDDWRPARFCSGNDIDERIAINFRSIFMPPSPTKVQRTIQVAKAIVRRGFYYFEKVYSCLYRERRKASVAIVNTFQKNGGAATAAHRLFQRVSRADSKAVYFNMVREDLSPNILGLNHWSLRGLLAVRLSVVDRLALLRYPRRQSGTFTPAIWSNPLAPSINSIEADVVHLHWLSFSMMSIKEMESIKVPIVWTLHDCWAFTGGCHYPGDCTRFESSCGACPQLSGGADDDLSRTVFDRKQNSFGSLNLTIVTPSKWLADLARRSSLLANRRIEVIPNGLDTRTFRPLDRAAAKSFLGVDPNLPLILFGAQSLNDKRKGADILVDALKELDFPHILGTFGAGGLPDLGRCSISVRQFGTMRDELSLAVLYSAADVFVCPSREDNLPNTVAESLACGTPCVAFAVNGLPDMIEHQVTGWLARAFDAADLAEGIRWILQEADPQLTRESCRAKALSEYDLDLVTDRYIRLYKELSSAYGAET